MRIAIFTNNFYLKFFGIFNSVPTPTINTPQRTATNYMTRP